MVNFRSFLLVKEMTVFDRPAKKTPFLRKKGWLLSSPPSIKRVNSPEHGPAGQGDAISVQDDQGPHA